MLLSLPVMMACKMNDDCRQLPLSGNLFFCKQLNVLLTLVLFGVVLVLCEFRMHLLRMSITCLMLFMQL